MSRFRFALGLLFACGFSAAPALAVPRLLRPSCAVCSLAPGPVCPACEADFFPAALPRCRVCAIPMHGPDSICGRCLSAPPHFVRATALADYAPPVDGMVRALKFGARLDLASVFGQLLARRTRADDGALVVPVPLAFERLAERGYNQSRALAAGVGRARGLPLADGLLRRVRETRPQSGEPLAARHDNLAGAFVAQARAAGGAWVVVDDVMTSGATLQATAAALKAAGARLVVNLVAARTLP